MIDTSKGLALERELDATPEAVYTAWTEADEVAQWWHPHGATTPREKVAVDARVGGRYVYTMVSDETGEEIVTGGVYLELVPFERLVLTWGDPDADPDDSPVVTLTLAEVDGRTRMAFDLRGVEGAPGDGFFHDGWVSALDSLEGYLGSLRG